MNTLILLTLLFALPSQELISPDIARGEPIPGVNVKCGRKPPGGNNFIGESVTNDNGTFEFTGLEAGEYTYFVDFSFKEKGIKAMDVNYRIEDIAVVSTPKAERIKMKPTKVTKTVETVEHGPVEINLTYDGSSLKGSVTALSMTRGVPVNQSRSNIKSKS